MSPRWTTLLLLVALLAPSGCRRPDVLSLNDFETAEELDRLTWRCPYWLEASPRFVTGGERGLLVEFPPRLYPTLELREVPGDWRGYTAFEADLFAPDSAGDELLIRIDDRGDSRDYADRFERVVPLTGEPQRLRIPLEEIRRGNGGRELDLSRMERVLFFLKRTDRRVVWYLDRVCLTR